MSSAPGDARTDQLNEDLNEVGNILDRLNNVGKDMNMEITRQTEQIGRIDQKVNNCTETSNACYSSSFPNPDACSLCYIVICYNFRQLMLI